MNAYTIPGSRGFNADFFHIENQDYFYLLGSSSHSLSKADIKPCTQSAAAPPAPQPPNQASSWLISNPQATSHSLLSSPLLLPHISTVLSRGTGLLCVFRSRKHYFDRKETLVPYKLIMVSTGRKYLCPSYQLCPSEHSHKMECSLLPLCSLTSRPGDMQPLKKAQYSKDIFFNLSCYVLTVSTNGNIVI